MLTATNIHSIYMDHANQASQERQRRADNAAADIIGDVAKKATMGQRAHHVKLSDVPRDIQQPVIDVLRIAGFNVHVSLRNGYQFIIITF